VQWLSDETNQAEYYRILNSRTFADDPAAPYSDDDLRAMLDGVRIHNPAMLRQRNQDQGELLTWIRELKAMLQQHNMLTADFSPEEIFDNRAMIKALEGMP